MALSAQNQSTSYVNLYYSIVQRAATRYFKEYYNSGEYQQPRTCVIHVIPRNSIILRNRTASNRCPNQPKRKKQKKTKKKGKKKRHNRSSSISFNCYGHASSHLRERKIIRIEYRLATCASSTFCQNYVIASARCVRAVSNFPALPPSLALAHSNTRTHPSYTYTRLYTRLHDHTRHTLSISVRFSLVGSVSSSC